MNRFCVATITTEESLRPRHGVLQPSALAVTTDARALAGQILQQARDEADAILQKARDTAQQLVDGRQQQVMKEADALLRALDGSYDTFLQGAQQMVLDLTQALFDSVLVEVPPRARMAAMLSRLAAEIPSKPVDAVLHVHPDDCDLLPAIDWQLRPDRSMSRGTCRLATANGEWRVDFEAAVSAVRQALAGAGDEAAAEDDIGKAALSQQPETREKHP